MKHARVSTDERDTNENSRAFTVGLIGANYVQEGKRQRNECRVFEKLFGIQIACGIYFCFVESDAFRKFLRFFTDNIIFAIHF